MEEFERVIRREYPDGSVVDVGVAIIRRGRVLLVKRGKKPGYGSWSIPGGAVELGEKLAPAIEREVLKETGFTVRAGEIVKVYQPVIRDKKGRVQYHYVLIDFVCEYLSGELKPDSDILDAVMAAPAELQQYHLPPATAALIRECLKAEGIYRIRPDACRSNPGRWTEFLP